MYFETIIALWNLKYRLVSAVIFSFDVCVLCQVARNLTKHTDIETKNYSTHQSIL